MKKGFTMIELLVVVAIIGILSAVAVGLFGGASESARATQCMTNMRGLGIAVVNNLTESSTYTAAATYKFRDTSRGLSYPIVNGWIASRTDGNNKTKVPATMIPFNTENVDDLKYAITNGVMWKACGGAEQLYRCPVHEQTFSKANKGRRPGWSYVMNQVFGYQHEKLHKYSQHSGKMRPTGNETHSLPPDKVLLFAEMQGRDIEVHGVRLEANLGDGSTKSDSVLQYKDGGEVIGFNHVQSGGKIAGHVVFADGHVEKLLFPKSGNVKELTKWLCEGHEVSYDGYTYSDMNQ